MSDQDTYDVVGSRTEFRGHIITVRVDDVRMSDGRVAQRDIVAHPGAVGVVALDDDGQIVLVNQYRPAVGARLDELPAGLLDVDGESALDAAKRELAEEARLRADDWHVLVDLHTSPGMTDEAIRLYLARDLHDAAPDSAFTAEHEEITMTVSREPLAEAVRRVLSGALTNAAAAAGILAAVHGRATGWTELRPADAPWPARPGR
ncbi:NUDIX domain-containing protein [uncultured Jatrophihabitans sp.]|uniref:NUDIX domain-containing protein n=1 Tax=uncultured Jatrophihabitans sp. TaxID=1610747 RepID=UPI0035C9C820